MSVHLLNSFAVLVRGGPSLQFRKNEMLVPLQNISCQVIVQQRSIQISHVGPTLSKNVICISRALSKGPNDSITVMESFWLLLKHTHT